MHFYSKFFLSWLSIKYPFELVYSTINSWYKTISYFYITNLSPVEKNILNSRKITKNSKENGASNGSDGNNNDTVDLNIYPEEK